jgi:hypothetical protein
MTREYRRNIKEMEKRLEERPFLFERFAMELAGQKAAAIVKETLESHGLNSQEFDL